MDEMRLPLVAVTGTLLFPGITGPMVLGRPRALAAVTDAVASLEATLVVCVQRTPTPEFVLESFYPLGVRARVCKVTPREQVSEVIMKSLDRVRVLEILYKEPFAVVRLEVLPNPSDAGIELEAAEACLHALVDKARQLGLEIPDPKTFAKAEPLGRLYLLACAFHLSAEQEQTLLASETNLEAFTRFHSMLLHEVEVLTIRKRISSQTKGGLDHLQREQFLRQNIVAIQHELGEDGDEVGEVRLLQDRLDSLKLPDLARTETSRQLRMLRRMTPAASEYQVARSYVELVLDLPWSSSTPDQLDLVRARKLLDEDHDGLQPVKDRILEHLAVMALNPEVHAPILCFVGPPGTGKTSLGQSVARVLGRKFERISLGGVRDDAELRGHRRTYVGAMTGRLLQALRRGGANNLLLMLDEVDKLCTSFEGDPAAALLEVLDPAQNSTFHDNYLGLPFDLSHVFFITTANSLDPIPRPLLDRMEVIRLPGYTYQEKLAIAERHLIPKVLEEMGLKDQGLTAEGLDHLLVCFTREAGVRQLERTLAKLFRRLALRRAEGLEPVPRAIGPAEVEELLGVEEFLPETRREDLPPGVVAGLAWTETGGQILYIEVALLPEGQELILTGHLGDVMKESARTAYSYVLSQARHWGFEPYPHSVHIHVPSGAVPKDGPSAGLAMVAALASAMSGMPARADTAMTGEVSLSGLILPVGGVYEKVLAAHRSGIRRLALPHQNGKDLSRLPVTLRDELDVLLVDCVEDVLSALIPGLHIEANYTRRSLAGLQGEAAGIAIH
jgi:ATP-dependent Lon protease